MCTACENYTTVPSEGEIILFIVHLHFFFFFDIEKLFVIGF